MSAIFGGVREEIEAARKQQTTELNLSRSHLTHIPAEVFQLEHLESLDLAHNSIAEVPKEIAGLKNLKTLRLGYNWLDAVPVEIGQLQKLETLDLGIDILSPLPDEIGQLSKLTTLIAGASSFPRTLGQLRNLSKLVLISGAHNPAKVPGGLAQLRNIKELTLIGFGLPQVPEWLAQRDGLTLLNLSGNLLSEIPDWLAQMQNLKTLWLDYNNLTSKIVAFPREMQDLSLAGNSIDYFPDSISMLQQLERLDLDHNYLSIIPDGIGNLVNLRSLSLRFNKIKTVSSRILQLTKLNEIYISDNPLESPPPEIAKRGLSSVREYFQQLTAEGMDHLYEAKLLIVGEAGAGKTTLARKIIDPNYELRTESTRGIDVIRWHFPLSDGRTFRVNIWDFGGQEIYHATHQFFLTKRSLYSLVADTRKEDTDFNYWLNVAELLSDGSPMLIIMNEKENRHREINERSLRGRFTSLKATLATNLSDGRGLDKILEEIRYQIAHLPHVGQPLPATWVRVREALERDPRDYISLEEYLAICEKHGFTGHKAKLQLSEYLHDLGVCLHFQDDPLLNRTVVLRPKWGTAAVYKLLDNPLVVRNLGQFTRADLEQIWDEPEYMGVHNELLQLMVRFKLCYPLPGEVGIYIAPQLLSANQPAFSWDGANNLLLRYSYKFMPKGILTQFIVAMHRYIAEQYLVWKTGVILSKDHTLAEVEERYDQREIRIRVSGLHRKDLLIIAIHELDKIHASYPRLEYSKLVPCNCSACKISSEPYFYELEVLRKFLADRQISIQCRRSYAMVDVLGLVDDAIGRDQLMSAGSQGRSGLSERPMSRVYFQGPVEQIVLQQTLAGEGVLHLEERRDNRVANSAEDAVTTRSAWANGLFYLLVFVIVIAAVGLLARSVSPYVLPAILIAGAIFVPLIGALQLRMDKRLSQKSFLELVKLAVGQLPLIRRMSKQHELEEAAAISENPPAD